MANLHDLFERINDSSLDEDVQEFVKQVLEQLASGKSLPVLDELIDAYSEVSDK